MYYTDKNYKNIPIPKEFENVYTNYKESVEYIGNKFSINEITLLKLKKAEYINNIYLELDKLADEQLYNERYIGTSKYEEYKQNFINQRIELLKQIK